MYSYSIFSIILVTIFLVIAAFLVMIGTVSHLRKKEKSPYELYEDNDISFEYPDIDKFLKGILFYDPEDPFHLTQDKVFIVGNYTEENIFQITELRDMLLRKGIDDVLYSCQDFILFFEKPEFQGKLYFVSCVYPYQWKAKTMTEAQKYYDNTDHVLQIQGKNKGVRVFSEEDTNEEYHNSAEITLPEFLREFNFHFNREFSCIVPEHIKIKMIPFHRSNVDDKPIVLSTGKYENVTYNIPSIREFHIMHLAF